MLLNDIKYWIDAFEIEGENIILTIYWILSIRIYSITKVSHPNK